MISPLDSAVLGRLYCPDSSIAEVFADTARIRDLLAVEAALARAEAVVGVIPSSAAQAITSAAERMTVDVEALASSVAATGVPAIDVVRQLRAAVGPDFASSVHYGATSQDIVDTATILALRRATAHIESALRAVVMALIDLAEQHRGDMMAGRTHGQHASPISFGLKAANWLGPFPRHWDRLSALKGRLWRVQFGGAVGSLEPLGAHGPAVLEALARELELAPAAPWHTQRDAIAEYGGWLALVAATLGKIGQDLILLAQTEVAEVFEQPDASRGSSSTMPHKSNPIASEMLVVAARAVGALHSALLAASIQEHERSTHGWQLEWLVLPQMVALTHGAATGGASILRRLHVDTARMRANVALAGDVALGESLVFALARRIGLLDAQALVKEAAARRRGDNESLVAVVRRLAAERHLDEIDWPELTARAHAGSANRFIDSIVAEAKRIVG